MVQATTELYCIMLRTFYCFSQNGRLHERIFFYYLIFKIPCEQTISNNFQDIGNFHRLLVGFFWFSDLGFDKRLLVKCQILITNGIISLSLPLFYKIEINLQKRTFPLWFSRFVSYSDRANLEIKCNYLIYTILCNFVKFYFRFSQKIENNVKIMAGNKTAAALISLISLQWLDELTNYVLKSYNR